MNILFPFITSVYVAHVLLPVGVGKVAFAQNLVTYFTLIASLGLPVYGTRVIAKYINNQELYNKSFWELFTINGISTFLCTLCYYSICITHPFFREDLSLYLVAGISIILNFINIDWLYQGREEYKYISIRGAIIKTLSLSILFLFVKSTQDYIVYAAIHCFVLSGNYIVNVIGLKSRIKLTHCKLQLSNHVKPLLILFATNVAIELYTLLDTSMLGFLKTSEIVGYYSYAMKISKICITVLVAATSVMLPKLSQYYTYSNKDKYYELANKGLLFTLVTAIPVTIILMMCANELIPFLYGVNFFNAVSCFEVLSFLAIPITLSSYLGVQILCSAGHESKMLIAVLVGAISNIILNLILIPKYNHEGAAIASLTSETIVAIIEIIIAYKLLHVGFGSRTFLKICLASIVLLHAMVITRFFFNNALLRMIVPSILGIIAYSICLLSVLKSLIKK